VTFTTPPRVAASERPLVLRLSVLRRRGRARFATAICGCALSLLPGAAPSQQPSARVVSVNGAFAEWRPVHRYTIADPRLNETEIGAFAVAQDGSVVVWGVGDHSLTFYDSLGARVWETGRRGSGPGEFLSISSLGWLSDTLVVLDRSARRLSYFAPSRREFVAVRLWPLDVASARPDALLTAGRELYAVVAERSGPSIPSPLAPQMRTPQYVRGFHRVTGDGVGVVPLGPRDASPSAEATLCADETGTIHGVGTILRDHGSLRALTQQGQLITAAREMFRITLHARPDGEPSLVLTRDVPPRPLTDAVWARIADRYLQLSGRSRSLTCVPPVHRPPNLPVVRALLVDDADRILIEVTERSGDRVYVVGAGGQKFGAFLLPARDTSVPWIVRDSKLYVVQADARGRQRIGVYALVGG
jgi:hypothetical protein